MSVTLPPLSGHPPLHLEFFKAGAFARSLNGWVHKKTVPYAILLEPREGCYRARFSGREIEIKRGQVLLLPADTEVEFVHYDGPRGFLAVRWLHLRFSVFGAADFFSFYDLPALLPSNESRAVSRIVDLAQKAEMLPLQDPRRIVRQHELATRVLSIVCTDARLRTDFWPDETVWRRLAPVMLHIKHHLADAITVGALARVAALSPARLHALFRKEFDTTPMGYVRRLRLEAASRWLVSSQATLSEIASKVGFEDPFHLSRSFKKHFGRSPREYRRHVAVYH